jgi:hypothetical protein
MPSITPSTLTRRLKGLSFLDVVKFAASYWVKQPKKLTVILLMLLTAALFEAYLPSALASFLGSIQANDKFSII